ncbi:hypothetical protein [Sulfitobacter sp. R18_1]|uniref:hypothetical protein n=1 Tax=Sulfitobacter sp. R18_1 TaxID=2821104 RepID=UPI001ADC3D3F|nr:hypothetical protein [Sulfitobacter sp. R18_1]MBO9428002.1 hypothetical protein [Sulfitobacter sp. R18_1]
MNITDPILAWLVRNCDRVGTFDNGECPHLYGRYLGRQVRYLTHTDKPQLDIGDGYFDRWANSVAVSFTPSSKDFPTQLNRAMFCAFSLKKNCTYINLDAIGFSEPISPAVFQKALMEAQDAA